MDRMREITDSTSFDSSICFPYSRFYLNFETNKVCFTIMNNSRVFFPFIWLIYLIIMYGVTISLKKSLKSLNFRQVLEILEKSLNFNGNFGSSLKSGWILKLILEIRDSYVPICYQHPRSLQYTVACHLRMGFTNSMAWGQYNGNGKLLDPNYLIDLINPIRYI